MEEVTRYLELAEKEAALTTKTKWEVKEDSGNTGGATKSAYSAQAITFPTAEKSSRNRVGRSSEDKKNDKQIQEAYTFGSVVGTKDTKLTLEWQVVKRREPNGAVTIKAKVMAKRERKRPTEIIVKVGNSSYSDDLRKVKTKSEVKSGEDSKYLLDTISKAIEDLEAVKVLEQMEKIVVLDIDEQEEEYEIVETLDTSYGFSVNKVTVKRLLLVSKGQTIGILKVS
ncbi:Hypothetical protein CINCED_3A004773 [Cinara cedri]|uniref:Uncharacterized protein n=1 Tax=Cinara cedri TaxID=506608 RepID=A0A5E4N7D2_9HEMI|nr:Hypothetical protein CINCED_3A004773 [Cinara cedri]